MKTMQRREAMRIGNHLRQVRRAHDRTQEELAELVGVSTGWISRIERGLRLPNLIFLSRVGQVLRVPLNELLPPERDGAKRQS